MSVEWPLLAREIGGGEWGNYSAAKGLERIWEKSEYRGVSIGEKYIFAKFGNIFRRNNIRIPTILQFIN